MIVTVTLNPAVDITLTVQSFAPGDVNRATETQKSAGGKGINVSRTLKVLGEPSSALTIVGSDSVREFQRLARDAGIQIIYISVPGEIRSNTHVMDNSTGLIYKVNQPGTTLDEIHFQHFKMLFLQQLKTASAVALGGSLPPESPADCYRVLAASAVQRGVPVLLDAVGPPLLESLSARPHIVKPNRKELEATLGIRIKTIADTVAACREMMSRGAQTLVISDGARSVLAMTADAVYTIRPPKIRAKGVTGAGDALAAGLLSKLVAGLPFPEAVAFGTAVATATCLTAEGETAEKSGIDRLIKKVVVERATI